MTTFHSTRSTTDSLTSKQAIRKGIADDGGLFVTDSLGETHVDIASLAGKSYQQIAFDVLSVLLPDYTEAELKECIDEAYGPQWSDEKITPVKPLGDDYVMELFNGPTSAFKDVALQILPRFMARTTPADGDADEKIMIVTATSGDTGKAALAGFADAAGTGITVFYPEGKVSQVQELQMTTQSGSNVNVCAVKGNFDDAQTGVKKIFGDRKFAAKLAAKGFQLSSANSINIGRLVPQVVYYVYAYAKLVQNGEIQNGDLINVTVPTGNFGNILAAYLAKQMGVPIKTLICASNDNKVLYDFFKTGTYDRKREFILTNSPSMDILISSNLERLIYLSTGCDAEANKKLMEDLSTKGVYTVTDSMKAFMKDFVGGYATEAENAAGIKHLADETGYIIDTHTGVASCVYKKYVAETGDKTPTVIASTASPYKFSHSVMAAVTGKEAKTDEFASIDALCKASGVAIPRAVEEIRNAEIRHNRECDAADMEKTVAEILGL